MLVYVYIKPGSRHREEVLEGEGGSLVVYTKAPAVEGQANKATIGMLAKYFGVSRSQIKLLRGQTSKYKVFEVEQ